MMRYDELRQQTLDQLRSGDLAAFVAAVRQDARLYADLLFKIETEDGTLAPLKYNAPQIFVHDCIEDQLRRTGRVRKIVLKARKQGITTMLAGRILQACSLNPHTKAAVLSHDAKGVEQIFGIYRRGYDHLPEAMQPMSKYYSKQELFFENPSSSASERRENPGLDSRIGVYTATKEAGRGSTGRRIHCSEVAFWDDAEATMTALLNTAPKGDSARGTEIYIESTANGVGGWFHDKYWAAKRGEMGEQFEAIFIPWYMSDKYVAKVPKHIVWSEEEQALFEEHPEWDLLNPMNGKKSLTPEQAFWRRQVLASDFNGNRKLFQQEFPLTDLEAFISSGECFFDVEDIHDRLTAIKTLPIEPMFVGEIAGEHGPVVESNPKNLNPVLTPRLTGRLKIWHPPDPLGKYVIFADVSSGESAGDEAVIEIYGRDGKHCAKWCGRVDPDDLADYFYWLGKYYNWAYGTPESNNHGGTTITRLTKVLRYRHLYFRKTYEKAYAEPTDKVGWNTSKTSRPKMLDAGRSMFKNGDVEINCPITLQQMLTFVRGTNGKWEAMKGSFDDHVMAFCGACAMLEELPPLTNEFRKKRKRRVSLDVDPVTGY